jgi:hypothetical protein
LVCTARFGNGRLGSAAHHCDGLARYHELSQGERISVPSQRARHDIRRPGQEGEFKGAEYYEFRNPSVSGSPLEAEDAEKAGLGIEHPILQVAGYDGVEA